MITGTSGISALTGGNCTRDEAEAYRREFADVDGWDGRLYEQDEERRIVRMLRGGTFPDAPSCPRPTPTPERTARAVQHRINTEARRANPKALLTYSLPFFDDEPAVRCREVCHVQNSE